MTRSCSLGTAGDRRRDQAGDSVIEEERIVSCDVGRPRWPCRRSPFPGAATCRRAPRPPSTAPGSPWIRSTTWPRRSARLPTAPPHRGVDIDGDLARAHQQSLGVLMDTELSRQYAEDEGITPPRRSRTASTSSSRASSRYRRRPVRCSPRCSRGGPGAVPCWWRPGSRETGQDPDPGNVEELVNAGLSAREPWLEDVEINTDPRYSPAANGSPAEATIRLAPQLAGREGRHREEPDPAWLSGLPASQKCG